MGEKVILDEATIEGYQQMLQKYIADNPLGSASNTSPITQNTLLALNALGRFEHAWRHALLIQATNNMKDAQVQSVRDQIAAAIIAAGKLVAGR